MNGKYVRQSHLAFYDPAMERTKNRHRERTVVYVDQASTKSATLDQGRLSIIVRTPGLSDSGYALSEQYIWPSSYWSRANTISYSNNTVAKEQFDFSILISETSMVGMLFTTNTRERFALLLGVSSCRAWIEIVVCEGLSLMLLEEIARDTEWPLHHDDVRTYQDRIQRKLPLGLSVLGALRRGVYEGSMSYTITVTFKSARVETLG